MKSMACAAREAEEETGWRPGPLRPLMRVHPTAGISDSVDHLYRADGATLIGPPQDDYESDRIDWVPLAGIPGLVARGEIVSGTTLAALLYVYATEIGATLNVTDAAATLNVANDRATLNVTDDGATLNVTDDGATLNVTDDGATLNVTDDGVPLAT